MDFRALVSWGSRSWPVGINNSALGSALRMRVFSPKTGTTLEICFAYLLRVRPMKWKQTAQPARLEQVLENGVVQCHLSPRNCKLKDGQHGFCGVRANQGGRLVTLNYGKSVHATEETI